MTDRYIKVFPDGSRSPRTHPGHRSAETGRLLTADALAQNHGFYLVVDDVPAYDPETQEIRPTDLVFWPIRDRRIVRTFEVFDRPPPPAHKVPKVVIVQRLHALGKLELARQKRAEAPVLLQELWDAAENGIDADNAEMRAYLRDDVGVDPDVIMAP